MYKISLTLFLILCRHIESKMNLLSGNSLAKAKTLIDQSGAKKNSISLLMELGQLLHSSPTIEVYEHQTLSSVHQHVFVCDVKFFQYSVEAVGYNKKKLKGDAATAMVDKLYNAMDANEEASKLNEQVRFTNYVLSSPVGSWLIHSAFLNNHSSNLRKRT